ncbi:MAG: hypothetical protein ACTHN5_03645, partial [Phycisphaerae bacterium]
GYLRAPALLNLERNRISVVDWPGEPRPPPPVGGMPIEDPEALSDYLLVHHIRYVAYSYASHANFYPQIYSAFLAAKYGPVIHRQVAESLAFQKTLEGLGRRRRVIFNNSAYLVIDLADRGE